MEGDTLGEIIRPLLEVRRRELEQYLKTLGQPWREDSTNTDVKFTLKPHAANGASTAGGRIPIRL